ncbi:MAG TPA: plastocyanin/azurin family copper-binding protein [Thermodesulfobacteriota bacterium]
MLTRRRLIGAGGLLLAGLAAASARPAAAGPVVEVLMTGDASGARVWFDPAELTISPGTTVRWVVERHVHTTTAYPDRIPAGATPWDSGYLVNPGDRFEITLVVPGTYHYFCRPHEAAGMVGRITVRSD